MRKKLAFVSTEPDNQESMRFRGRKCTIREMLSSQLKERGLEPIIYRPVADLSDFPKLDRCHGIILGGSKLNILDEDIARHPWMAKLVDFIRESHGKMPMLGLCFGHQAVGRAFGSDIGKLKLYEVGFRGVYAKNNKDDQLFFNVPEKFDALFSHFSYVSDIPGATVLAVSQDPENPSVQAFRVGDLTWGIQFHPEYSADGVADLVIARRKAIEHMVDVDHVLEGLKRQERYDTLPFENFVRLVKQH